MVLRERCTRYHLSYVADNNCRTGGNMAWAEITLGSHIDLRAFYRETLIAEMFRNGILNTRISLYTIDNVFIFIDDKVQFNRSALAHIYFED